MVPPLLPWCFTRTNADNLFSESIEFHDDPPTLTLRSTKVWEVKSDQLQKPPEADRLRWWKRDFSRMTRMLSWVKWWDFKIFTCLYIVRLYIDINRYTYIYIYIYLTKILWKVRICVSPRCTVEKRFKPPPWPTCCTRNWKSRREPWQCWVTVLKPNRQPTSRKSTWKVYQFMNPMACYQFKLANI